MRENIYYWKCDSPLANTEKKSLFFKDKYKQNDITKTVIDAVYNWRGEKPDNVIPANCDGNHFAYIIKLKNREKYFFRGDEGIIPDDYMLAEEEMIKKLSKSGVPVPQVHFSSQADSTYPVSFQILDYIETPCLNVFYKNNELDITCIADQLGKYLKKIHSVNCEGFGFFNTEKIKEDKILIGLDSSYADYFNKCLDKHLEYLQKHKLLTQKSIADIKSIFNEHANLLNLKRGFLVHRDIALWNILGTRNNITSIIDWDDCISGDPADDFGILNCFFEDEFMIPLLNSYSEGDKLSEDFLQRTQLHKLRNMLWKTMIRHYMGYFEKGSSFFLINKENSSSLKNFTINKILSTINYFKKC